MIECAPKTRHDVALRLTRRFQRLEDAARENTRVAPHQEVFSERFEKLGVKKLLSNVQNTVFNRDEVKQEIEHQVRLRTADLFRKANFDALTHLPNRRYFHEILDGLVVKYKQEKHPFALLFLDLDGFKKVNDTLGHNVGDELLRHVGARLQSSVRHGDIVSRLGGDEFVVLLTESPDKDTIEMICKRIIKEVSRSYGLNGIEVKTSTSIGVARFPEDATTASELIQHADEALYNSKASGRRTYRFYGDGQTAPTKPYATQAKFDEAISQGKIEIHASPLMDLQSHKVVGAQLNLIWPNSGLVSDDLTSWCPYLLKSGWDYSAGLWLVDSACHYFKHWKDSNEDLQVSIPVLDSLWRSGGFIELLIKRVQSHGLAAKQFNLMFSLQELVTYDAFFGQVLRRLKLAGFQIVLVGLGKVPLDTNLIANLEVDIFQMDQQWLQGQLTSSHQIKWVQGLIQLAGAVGAKVMIPEQTQPQEIELCRAMGADLSYGSYWAPAVSIAEFAQWLNDDLIEVA